MPAGRAVPSLFLISSCASAFRSSILMTVFPSCQQNSSSSICEASLCNALLASINFHAPEPILFPQHMVHVFIVGMPSSQPFPHTWNLLSSFLGTLFTMWIPQAWVRSKNKPGSIKRTLCNLCLNHPSQSTLQNRPFKHTFIISPSQHPLTNKLSQHEA